MDYSKALHMYHTNIDDNYLNRIAFGGNQGKIAAIDGITKK